MFCAESVKKEYVIKMTVLPGILREELNVLVVVDLDETIRSEPLSRFQDVWLLVSEEVFVK